MSGASPKNPQRVKFTPAMDAALLAMRKRLHAAALAEHVGVSNAVMYRRLRELNQPIRPCRRTKRNVPKCPATLQGAANHAVV